MKTVTVQYGIDSLTSQVDDSTTVGQLKKDQKFQTALGYGDNVNVLIEGVAQCDEVAIPAGCLVKVETAANKKG